MAEGVTAYYTFKDKFEKCKNIEFDAFYKSFKLRLMGELI